MHCGCESVEQTQQCCQTETTRSFDCVVAFGVQSRGAREAASKIKCSISLRRLRSLRVLLRCSSVNRFAAGVNGCSGLLFSADDDLFSGSYQVTDLFASLPP